jgi:hypothetical protein
MSRHSVSVTIEYDGQSHSIRLRADSKEGAKDVLKSVTMERHGIWENTINWLFDDLWNEAA